MANKKITLGILCNELEDNHLPWVRACKDFSHELDYRLLPFTGSDWLLEIKARSFDYFLATPPGLTSIFKQLYDERIFILDSVLNQKIYPKPIEIFIHENKRFLHSWLKANKIPHPETSVFYHKDEAKVFINSENLPLVAKVNIGASGSGVKILKTEKDAFQYIDQAFSSKGAPKRWGPNLSKGNLLKRGLHYLLNPKDIIKRKHKYASKKSDRQVGFVLFQEYIPHDYEWRIVVIGDSYFAHKKLKIGEKASGSLLKQYDNPPLKLFDFAKEIMEKHGLYSQAIDVFETEDGHFLVNEMQCMFGQSDPYQMLIDGKPGRYLFKNGNWVFEKGDFNANQSYNLRLEHVLKILGKQ